MSRVLAYLGRLVMIVAGFAFASLAASAFLHLLVLGGMPWTQDELAFAAGGFLISVPFVALFVGYFAFVPAIVAILLAEIMGWRGWLYFVLAGAAAGLAVVYLARLHLADERSLDLATLSLALAGTGMVGGLAYWLVAGRDSGRALDGAVSARMRSGS